MPRVAVVCLGFLVCINFTLVRAQDPPARTEGGLLARVARLDVRDVSVPSALQRLSSQSRVPIIYTPSDFSGTGVVSCSCLDSTVQAALEIVLAGSGMGFVETRHGVVVGRSGEVGSARMPVRQTETLNGVILSASDSQPIRGARVHVPDRSGELRTDSRGRFGAALVPGTYDLEIRILGYAQQTLREVLVTEGEITSLTVYLEPAPLRLSEIVVTPGTYGILREASVVPEQTLTRDYVHALPRIGDDVYRAVDRLPGVATHDITARIHVRGAPDTQVLVELDGLELSEPFHLKDWDGSLSIIDVESVADIDLSTGGFTAEYGDKMTGVFSMHTTTPPADDTRTTIGFSVMNLTAKSEGGFGNGRGTWLASGRYGFMGPVLKILGEANGAEPTYYDVLSKVQYQLNPRHLVSGRVLHAGDDFAVVEEDGTSVNSRWSSSYAWVTWNADFTNSLSSRTIFSMGRVTRERFGRDFERDGTAWLSVEDESTHEFLGFKQDWNLLADERLLLKWGVDVRAGSANYDYHRWKALWIPNTDDPTAPAWERVPNNLLMRANPSGEELGIYQSNRIRILDRLTVELGLRYDHRSHTGDNTLSPRVNLAFDVTPRTTLRGAWGWYHQSHGVDELYVADGDDRFYPAQRAEHRVVGLEHRLDDGTSFRVEAYERRITDPRPEYRTLVPTIEALWEESEGDRIRIEATRGRAQGIELLARRDVGGRFAWSASYALALAEDDIAGQWTSRPYEQRHTIHVELAYRPTPMWSLSYAWQYHSGWPATDEYWITGRTVDGLPFTDREFGPIYGARLPEYHRLDIRASRLFSIGNGTLEVFLDVFNVYNRKNAETFEYHVWMTPSGRVDYEQDINPLLRIFPTFGARWEF